MGAWFLSLFEMILCLALSGKCFVLHVLITWTHVKFCVFLNSFGLLKNSHHYYGSHHNPKEPNTLIDRRNCKIKGSFSMLIFLMIKSVEKFYEPFSWLQRNVCIHISLYILYIIHVRWTLVFEHHINIYTKSEAFP